MGSSARLPGRVPRPAAPRPSAARSAPKAQPAPEPAAAAAAGAIGPRYRRSSGSGFATPSGSFTSATFSLIATAT
jgi:hypothetical protein